MLTVECVSEANSRSERVIFFFFLMFFCSLYLNVLILAVLEPTFSASCNSGDWGGGVGGSMFFCFLLWSC